MAQKLDVNAFVADYCEGVKDKDLLTKHGLTVKQMVGIVKKLIKEGRITKAQYFDRNRKIKERETEEEKQFLKSLYHCPVCGHIHPTPFIRCPACGTDITKHKDTRPDEGVDTDSLVAEATELPEEQTRPTSKAEKSVELEAPPEPEPEPELPEPSEPEASEPEPPPEERFEFEPEQPVRRPPLRPVPEEETRDQVPAELWRLVGAGVEELDITASDASAEVFENYRISDVVIHGDQLTLFKAEDPDGTGDPIAVKLFNFESVTDEEMDAFLKELALCQSNMADLNVVTSLGTARVEGKTVLLSEYLPVNGAWLLREEPDGLPVGTMSKLLPQILNGLGYSHLHRGKDGVVRKVPHLSVTPSRLVLNEERSLLKVDDCGLIWSLIQVKGHVPHLYEHPLIDPAYLAPEAFVLRSRSVNPYLADIYALGVTLYTLITGQLPFQGGDLEEYKFAHLRKFPIPPKVHRYTLPPWLDAMILKCLEKEPEQRWRSATQMELNIGKTFTV